MPSAAASSSTGQEGTGMATLGLGRGSHEVATVPDSAPAAVADQAPRGLRASIETLDAKISAGVGLRHGGRGRMGRYSVRLPTATKTGGRPFRDQDPLSASD